MQMSVQMGDTCEAVLEFCLPMSPTSSTPETSAMQLLLLPYRTPRGERASHWAAADCKTDQGDHSWPDAPAWLALWSKLG